MINLINQATAKQLLQKYEKALQELHKRIENKNKILISGAKAEDQNRIAAEVAHFIANLKRIADCPDELRICPDQPNIHDLNPIKKYHKLKDIVDHYCKRGSKLKLTLDQLLHEKVFIRQVLLSKPAPGIFALEFPRIALRHAFIKNLNKENLIVKGHKYDMRVFMLMDKKDDGIVFPDNEIRTKFIKLLGLKDTLVSYDNDNAKLFIKDERIKDCTKTIPIAFLKDENEFKKFGEKQIAKNSKQLFKLSKNSNSFFSKLPADINIKIASLTGNGALDEKKAEKIARTNFKSI